ncbi:MAG: FG-GAP-like repeat-containing protein, partial [Candidatus Omnitrophica bacterium]|nr:FG-GAP-like repeat-containing protein [Candidatus Omnitrophota bacterium]
MRKVKVWVLSAIAIIALVSIRDKEIVLNVPSGQALTAEAYHSAQAATSSTSLTTAASTTTLTTNQSTAISAPTGTSSSSGSTGGNAVTEDTSDSGTTSTSQSNGSTSSQSSATQPESSSTTTAASAGTSAASASTDSVVYYGLTSTSETNDEEEEDEAGATNATNNAPVVSSYVPSASSASVTAGSSVSFSINATDADGDTLSYTWLFDGASLTNTANAWAYSPLAADVGSHTVGVVVSDGSLTTGMTWTVTVSAESAATGAIHINSLLPDSATKGVNVVIQGGGFSETASENIVKFGSVQASSVGVVSSNQIRATVPDGISAGFKDLTVSVGSDTSNSAMFNYLADSSSAVFINQTSSLIPAGMTLNDSSIIRLADIDGDNDIDLLVVDTTSGKLYILTNNASGVFTNETSARIPSLVYSNATHITDVKFGDINNDGYPEIVIAYSASEGQSARLLINSGTGTFTDMTSADLPMLTGDVSALDIGDANGDGYADIVVASRDSSDALLINNGSGVFTRDTAFALPVVIDGSSDIRFCDVNNDGALDIITTNNEIVSVSELRNRIYVNNGSGIFTDATETLLPADSDYSEVLDVGDINNDGNIDLVVADYTQNLIFMNTGSGFEDKTSTLIGANYFHSNCIKLGDMNGDGYQDIVVIGDDGSSLLLNDKTGSFAANDGSIKLPNYSGIPAAVGGNSVQLADVNGDGTLDIIVGGASLYILTSSVTDKAPVLDAIGDKSVEAGKTLSFSVNASDPNGDAITYTAANLPNGATFNTTSKSFSWTPDTAAVGDYANIVFTATENTTDALADSENIKISVISGLPVIDYYIPDTTDISATIGNVVQFGISAHDPKGGAITYTWYFNGEVIPNITDSSASNIFIFPRLGDNTISIKVANSTGSVSVSWDLTVTDTDNEVPEITAYSPASSSISVNLSNESLPDFSVTATDAEGDPLTYCWRIDGQTVSSTATLTSAQYSTLATVGSHIVMAYVSDGVNTAVAKAWTLGVTQVVNSAPVISSYSPIEAEKTIDLTVGGFINFAISASDPEGVALVYTWEFDNNIVSTTSSLVASAYSASATVGDHLVKVSISDGYNTPVSRQWVIHIVKTNQAPVIASYSPSSSSVNVDLATETLPDFSITVTDRENDTLAYSWTIDGTAVSSASSLLKAAYASTATVGTHAIVASVSDGTNTAVTKAWTIHVIKTNQAPVIASYSPSSLSVNVDLATETLPDFSITVTDRENDTLAYSWT